MITIISAQRRENEEAGRIPFTNGTLIKRAIEDTRRQLR
jgi:hypothetical protein